MLKNSSASAARVADAGACSGACGARNLMLAKESETSVLYKASWYPDKSQGSSLTTARNQLAGAPSLLANITSLLSGHEFSHPSMTSRSGQYRVSLLRNPTGERESPRCCSGPRWILPPAGVRRWWRVILSTPRSRRCPIRFSGTASLPHSGRRDSERSCAAPARDQ